MMIKERPIIMSTESVRAILAGRKTQTRRVCKPQPLYDVIPCPHNENFYVLDGTGGGMIYLIPPYKVGDRLWVKEAWFPALNGCYYKADVFDENNRSKCGWKNPMFMPRKFSRLTLKVIDVRIERLMKITVKDLYDEGFHTGDEFIRQWDTLNAQRGFPASSNPFVWVIEFRRIEKEAT